MMRLLARLRVPLGFACGGIALWLAQPTRSSIAAGLAVALGGELVRIWAAGHIEKGREVTRSGPYRFVRHPLYLGSAIMGAGFIWAAQSEMAGVVVLAYLGITLISAIRTEEAALTAKFGDQYQAYRERRQAPGDAAGASPVDRRFSWARVRANREHRAIVGLVAAGGLLLLRSQ